VSNGLVVVIADKPKQNRLDLQPLNNPYNTPPTELVIGYSGRLITGLQMRCPAERCSQAMSAEGNPLLPLRKSIDRGTTPNKAGPRVHYLEIYEPDVLADEMQPVLQYAASLFR
jgi:hypothetical protein